MNPYSRPATAGVMGPPPLRTGGPIKSITTGSNKVLVTNLDSDVTEDDVEEIFEQAGLIKSITIRKDSSGRSLGTAEVIFTKRAVAAKTVEDYDGAAVDGRPMYLRMLDGPGGGAVIRRTDQERFTPRVRDTQRVERSSFRGSANEPLFGFRGSTKEAVFGTGLDELDYSTVDTSEFSTFRRSRGRGRGRGGGFMRSFRTRGRSRGRGGGWRGGGRGDRESESVPSVEQLNKDMDSYFGRDKGSQMTD